MLVRICRGSLQLALELQNVDACFKVVSETAGCFIHAIARTATSISVFTSEREAERHEEAQRWLNWR